MGRYSTFLQTLELPSLEEEEEERFSRPQPGDYARFLRQLEEETTPPGSLVAAPSPPPRPSLEPVERYP